MIRLLDRDWKGVVSLDEFIKLFEEDTIAK